MSLERFGSFVRGTPERFGVLLRRYEDASPAVSVRLLYAIRILDVQVGRWILSIGRLSDVSQAPIPEGLARVIPMETRRPHKAGIALCRSDGCLRWWAAVVPADIDPNTLECPGCGAMTGRLGGFWGDAPLAGSEDSGEGAG